MRRRYLLPPAILLVALAATWLLVAERTGPDAGRVYTVAGILDVTGRNPAAWDGKVVRVHSAVEPGLMLVRDASRLPSVALAAPAPGYVPLADGPAASAVIWVAGRGDRGLAALLRRLPVAGVLVPRPRAVEAGVVITYRIALHADPALCPSPTCVTGTLLDYTAGVPRAAPGFPSVRSQAALQ